MRATFMLPLSMLALAACSSESTKEKSSDEVIAEAKQMTAPLPGLYETTAELREFTVPGMPTAQVEMMKKQFAANSAQTSTMCLTKADADKGFENMVRQMGEMGQGVKCAFSQFDAANANLNAVLNCTGQGGMKMAITMDGTVKPESSDVTMSMKSSSSMMPNAEMNMVVQSKSKRVGDCPS